jgi:predicted transcriptional regulator
MVYKSKELELATYYRKQGFSYTEIANLCGVSKGTVSNWFAKKRFSKSVRQENTKRAARDNAKRLQLLNKLKKIEREKLYAEAVRSAEAEFKHYKNDPLFIAGLMLYLGEGDNKSKGKIRIANSKASVHRIFFKFLQEYLGVPREKIRFWLLLYPDLEERACVRKWQGQLKLGDEQWYKNQVIQGKSEKRTLQYGVGNTIIGSTVLKAKLYRWLELAEKWL